MFEHSITVEICDLIQKYMIKHPIAQRCGSEYVFQNDEAQIDAVQLVADITDVFAARYVEDEFE